MAVNQCVVGVVDSVSASSWDFLTLVNRVNHCQPLSPTSIPSTTVTPVNYVNPSTTVNRVNHCQPPSPAFPAFNPFNRCVVEVVERTSASSCGFWPLSTVSTTFNHVQPLNRLNHSTTQPHSTAPAQPLSTTCTRVTRGTGAPSAGRLRGRIARNEWHTAGIPGTGLDSGTMGW